MYGKIIDAEYFALAWDDGTTDLDPALMPKSVELLTAFPNPFNQHVTIEITLPELSRIDLSIYDLGGRKMHELLKGEYTAGKHFAVWDGKMEGSISLPSGIYWVRLETEREITSLKLLLLR